MFVLDSVQILAAVRRSLTKHVLPALEDDFARVQIVQTLKALEARLNPELFVRGHRSLIINIDCVAAIEPYGHGEYTITMQDGTRLTTSRTYGKLLQTLLGS